MNYRFFTQSRDRSSFWQLSKVYEKLPVSHKLKLEFCDARQLLNKLLDQKISITIKNETPSRRELIDVFLYGCLAHAESPKKEIFDEWSKNSIAYAFMEAEFCDTLQRVLRIILHVSQINEKVIKELENNSPTV